MKEEENKKQKEENNIVNENAEYIVLDVQNKKILVDMFDIKDIQFQQEIHYQDENQQIQSKKIYIVIYNNDIVWQVPLNDDDLKIWKDFKNKNNK